MQKSRLGPFVLEENLAPGRDGSVYRAIHVQQRRAVALKLLRKSAAEGSLDDFRRELEFLKSLIHANIVQSFGGGIGEGERYLVMELVTGESVAAVLARQGKLPWQTAVELLLHVCAGLEYAHQRNVFHLALAPDKLLVAENRQVLIVDFRRDRQERAGTMRLTAAEVTAEQAPYLSPEQIRGRGGVSHKSDLYALGCIAFELLTGRPPFTNASVDELLSAHLMSAPPRVSSLVFDCPVWLDALVDRLLEKQPANRPAFASAVSVALQETKDRVAAHASVAEQAVAGATGIQVAAEPEARGLLGRKKRNRRENAPFYERAWFLAGCILLLLGAGTWAAWPASEAELFAKADALMQSDEPSDWTYARTHYLGPLLDRFPDGDYAPAAQAHLDSIDMAQAERRMLTDIRYGREPASEGERLYADALRYEQFGDRLTALEKYRALENLLGETADEAPFVKLARRQIAAIGSGDAASTNRAEFLVERLARAEELETAGKPVEARTLRRSVIALYGNNRELAPLVEQARAALERDGEEQESEAPAEPSSRAEAASSLDAEQAVHSGDSSEGLDRPAP